MNLKIFLKKLFVFGIFFCVFNFIQGGVLVTGSNMKNGEISKLDINIATEGEMLKKGVTSSYVEKIGEYRRIVGGFSKLDELKRISGIGEKTYKKLEKHFCIKSSYTKRRFSINSSDDMTLKYFGFTPKEIKALRKKIDSGDYINNNLELNEFLKSEKRYREFRDIVDYSKR